MGYISSRPSTIRKDNASLLSTEKAAKFPAGPTSSSPGPTLLMQVITAVRVVPKEKFAQSVDAQSGGAK